VSSVRRHLGAYVAQWRHRLPEDEYVPGLSDPDYIFLAARLWEKEAETNRFRANFLRACKAIPGLTVDGGFIPRERGPLPGFEDVTVARTYRLQDYLQRTKRSGIVFNTPAVAGCHGWKLAEFLALGKAIISTPISRAMPQPLVHGVHAHFVDGSERSISEAVNEIRLDETYRRRLERNARDYYERHLKPEVVVRWILEIARQTRARAS
jgi:glycosyltransferase involved in cell wall biosynthesis